MNDLQILGTIVSAVITLGGFIAVIMKFIQPINDLRVVIQKLNDTIDSLKMNADTQNRRIAKHGEQIDNLDKRVGKIENKMETFHKN